MIGRTVSHYEVLARLGEGGMGVVYRARDMRLGREVALKLLPLKVASPDRRLRFVREARAASVLNHPNIVTIYEIADFEGYDFISMELVRGRTLDQLLQQGPLPLADTLRYAGQIADALGAAHAQGIIHRDLKPSNIMVTRSGLLKVLDFGLAKLVDSLLSSENAETFNLALALQTIEGTIIGTVAYMSPEQAEGKPLDARSDMFSFGAVLYEMATGRRAFKGDSDIATLAAVLKEDPPPVWDITRGAPPGLSEVIARCLRKTPEERYFSMAEVKAALESVAAGQAPAGAEIPRQTPSLAVLPFSDLSPQHDQEHFCDGITEEILNALAKVPGLRVASRTASFRFKGRDAELSEIARGLKVRFVLHGSIRKAGDRLRITVELVNVEDGFQLWSERYDRDMQDVFGVQDEISQAIVDALTPRLTSESKKELVKRHTENPEAYNLYLRGRFFWNRRDPDSLGQAVSFFEQAIVGDPGYALAYSGIADCHLLLGLWFRAPWEEMPKAKAAALRALELDGSLAEAYASLAFVRTLFEWDWDQADRDFRRALELNPRYAFAHSWYSILLTVVGRWDEAKAQMRQAQEIDPVSIPINYVAGILDVTRRQFDEATALFEGVLEMEPRHLWALRDLGSVYLAKGMHEKARELLVKARELSGGRLQVHGLLAACYMGLEQTEEARRLLEEAVETAQRTYFPALHMAQVQIALGDHASALECLERAFEERFGWTVLIGWHFFYDPLRGDPRFTRLLERMGLAGLQAAPSVQ